jgi:hypothetical protein
VSLVEKMENLFSSKLAPGYKALAFDIVLPDASGQGRYEDRYDAWARKYGGDAKTQVVRSVFCEKDLGAIDLLGGVCDQC